MVGRLIGLTAGLGRFVGDLVVKVDEAGGHALGSLAGRS
jgi:hypothetical protein